MSDVISNFRLWRIELPVGRPIGDWMCRYSAFSALVIALTTRGGLTGWGFGLRATRGEFARPVPWHADVPALDLLKSKFEGDHWPDVRGLPISGLGERLGMTPRKVGLTETALRGALWDLHGKSLDLPLHKVLNAQSRDSVRAYASNLEFHLSDSEIRSLCQKSSNLGMTSIKVKLGHSDVHRDIERLKLILDSMPTGTEIAVDANTAWTAEEAIRRVEQILQAGIAFSYVEDPLPVSDVAGYQSLAQRLPVDVVGHDYAGSVDDLKPLLEVGGLQRLRIHSDIDYALAVGTLAEEYDLPIIVGNMVFEQGVHAAVSFPRVERIEFADLGWNDLPEHPVVVTAGQMLAPQLPGFGLDPDLMLLERLNSPSVDARLQCPGVLSP